MRKKGEAEMAEERPAGVLLSGGLASAPVLAMVRDEGFRPFALSFDYGQRHRFELEAARAVAVAGGVQRHVVVPLDLRAFGGSRTHLHPVAHALALGWRFAPGW